MHIPPVRHKLFAVAIAWVSLFATGWAYADPPLRAARLGYTEGQVSFSPAGEPDWVQSVVNRPLTTGDRLWVDARSRAEVQIGGSAIRMGEKTNVTLLNVDDNITQVQLTQGTLKLHVRRIDANQILEVDTPNLALTLHKAGDYRLDVSPNGDVTEVRVQGSGEAEVYGDGASYVVRAGQGYRFFGTGLSDHENVMARGDDDLDRWSRERERRIDASVSVRYVSSELVGYEDLDANGTWRADPTYGNVWSPSRVAVGWTPYHDGHWAWVNPWGWTWVDAAPWGYAVSHYGRWAHIRGAWAWVPGPVRERAVYAPALVVFLGGAQFQGNSVGWFPLAPREVYQPSYRVSRGYFDHVNHSNAVIAPATLTNIYNTHVTNVTNVTNVSRITYVNRDVTGAVVAVPMHAFAQSQSVAKAAMPLPKDAALRATVGQIAAVVPVVQSVHGGAPDASAKPPAHDQHHVIARTAPPPQPLAFAAQQPQLAAKPGAPLEDPRRGPPKRSAAGAAAAAAAAAAEPAPQVKLVNNTKPPIASAVPPPVAPHHRKAEDERKPELAKPAPPPGAPPAPIAPAAPGIATQATTPAATGVAPPVAPSKPADLKAEAMAHQAEAARQAEATRAAAAAAQAEKAKSDAARNAEAKAQADKAQADKAKATADEVAKTVAARNEAARAAAAKADAERSRVARDDLQKAAAARQEAARADAARAAAAKAQAEHAKQARDEAQQRDRATKDAAAHAARVESPRPAAAPAPTPTPNQAHPEPRHEHPQAAKPGEKKDRHDEDAQKH